MNKRYIDIDSGFRDRKLWPNPAEFGIQLAQTGTKYGIVNAKNPVSLAYPYWQWQWGCIQVGTNGGGLDLGGTGATTPPSNVAITFPRGGAGTSLQPMAFDAGVVLGTTAIVPPGSFSQQVTSTNNFFNGLLFQAHAPLALGGATGSDYSTSRIIAYKANTNILNTLRPQYTGIFSVESGLTPAGNWDAGSRWRIENNLNAGATTLGTFIGPEVFIAAGINADGVYVGDIYEAVMYRANGGFAGGASGACHQFRTITAYDGTRRVVTLDRPLVGWTSPANDTNWRQRNWCNLFTSYKKKFTNITTRFCDSCC